MDFVWLAVIAAVWIVSAETLVRVRGLAAPRSRSGKA